VRSGALGSPSVLIRRVTPADLATVVDLAIRANEQFRDAMGATVFRAYLSSLTDVERRAESTTVLVAELGERVIGTITLYADANAEGMPVVYPDRTAGIRALAVEPEVRGRGIASELVAGAIERARRVGATAIALHTSPFMVVATRLYESHGFQRTPKSDCLANDILCPGSGKAVAALGYLLELD
jgi:GNAT superfamily N-acetyltransferase